MKRLRYIGWCCMVAACQTLLAQTEHPATLQWIDDNHLKVEWTEPAGRGLKSEYSRFLTPMLCNGTDTMRLPVTVVRGKLNRKRLNRALQLNGILQAGLFTAHDLHPDDTIRFEQTVTAEPWMRQGAVSLCISTETEGCCNVTTLPVRCLTEAVYIPPFDPQLTPLEEKGKAGELEKRYPIVRPIAEYQPNSPRSPMYINFPLDRYTVLRDYRENARRLDLIVDMTREIMADTISRICLIQIVGKASPEGPLRHNIELAGNRVNALKNYLQERVDLPDSLLEIINGGEAWDEFRAEVAATDLPYRQDILDIIDHTEDVNLREARIKKYRGGKPYKYLLENVLLEQRFSGYMQIYYDYKPDTVPPIVNRSIELIREGRNVEALRLVQSVSHDKRSYNTLATALYLNGRRKEAETYYRSALENGDENAARNMRQIEAIAAQEAYLLHTDTTDFRKD